MSFAVTYIYCCE